MARPRLGFPPLGLRRGARANPVGVVVVALVIVAHFAPRPPSVRLEVSPPASALSPARITHNKIRLTMTNTYLRGGCILSYILHLFLAAHILLLHHGVTDAHRDSRSASAQLFSVHATTDFDELRRRR